MHVEVRDICGVLRGVIAEDAGIIVELPRIVRGVWHFIGSRSLLLPMVVGCSPAPAVQLLFGSGRPVLGSLRQVGYGPGSGCRRSGP